MEKKNDEAPATRKDIRELQKQVADSEYRVKLYFDAAVENIRHDLLGANADKLSLHDDKLGQHEERLNHIEKRVGLAH